MCLALHPGEKVRVGGKRERGWYAGPMGCSGLPVLILRNELFVKVGLLA
jgi:hypothetical protein